MEDGKHRIALTIAGSDSGGGAGLQADGRTFTAFGCHAVSVVTAVTAQNTLGVHAVHPVPVDIVRAQLDAVADDLPPDACKSGMLATRENVEAAAAAIAAHGWSRYVLDPVLASSSGDSLLAGDAVDAMCRQLMPLALCVTPNLDEAEQLTGLVVRDGEAMVTAAHALLEMGARTVLVKGGHLASDILVDILVTPTRVERFRRARIHSRGTHGTGCTLSAALTALLARGMSVDDAVPPALRYVETAIRAAPGLGRGIGPLGPGTLPAT